MRPMMLASLILNVTVLIPVCCGILLNATWARDAYGPDSSARQILLAVYMAIGIMSTVLIVHPDPRMVTALLLMQIIYKLATPLTVGTMKNPVVLSNLAICIVHVITLTLIWQRGMLATIQLK